MPVFSKGDTHLLFIHIPKSGGSSVTKFFADSGWAISFLDESDSSAFGALNRVRKCSPQHMESSQLRSTFDLSKFAAIFTLVRDPIERVKSEFAWRNALMPAESRHEKRFLEWWETTRDAYETDNYTLDNHIRPQHEFLVDGAKIFRFETELDGVRDLEAQFAPDNSARGAKEGSLEMVNQSWNTETRFELSKASVTKLTAFYKEDFKILGYRSPMPGFLGFLGGRQRAIFQDNQDEVAN